MTKRKKIKRLEEDLRALACAGYQEMHNCVIRDYLGKEFERLQKRYITLTGDRYEFSPCDCNSPQGENVSGKLNPRKNTPLDSEHVRKPDSADTDLRREE